MRHRLTAKVAMVAVVISTAFSQSATLTCPAPVAAEDGIDLYFSPKGNCTDAIVSQINDATKSILVQAYSFTSVPIAQALMEAHSRGIEIAVVLDSTQQSDKYSSATFLFNQGIATFIDPHHAIAHNKIMLIDGNVVVTGSFNFSKAAEESNAENLLFIRGKAKLYAAYEENFKAHLAHSVRYERRDALPAREAETLPATQPSTTTTPGDEAPIMVHVTKSGNKYHREGCRFLATSDSTISLKDAKAKGYTPCSACNPPS